MFIETPELESIRAIFVRKLAERNPNHPWLTKGPFAKYAVTSTGASTDVFLECSGCGKIVTWADYEKNHAVQDDWQDCGDDAYCPACRTQPERDTEASGSSAWLKPGVSTAEVLL